MQCSRSGRICEGYARYPVFLNRGLEGPEKRFGLEEAKASRYSEHGTPESSRQQSAINPGVNAADSPRAIDDRMLAQPSHANVFNQQVISSFWEKYVPFSARAQNGTPCAWFQQVISLPNPGEALSCSLKAFAMTRLGWIHGDKSLALQGNTFYSRALQVLRKALLSENMIYEDQIFAAGYVLSVYEVRGPSLVQRQLLSNSSAAI